MVTIQAMEIMARTAIMEIAEVIMVLAIVMDQVIMVMVAHATTIVIMETKDKIMAIMEIAAIVMVTMVIPIQVQMVKVMETIAMDNQTMASQTMETMVIKDQIVAIMVKETAMAKETMVTATVIPQVDQITMAKVQTIMIVQIIMEALTMEVETMVILMTIVIQIKIIHLITEETEIKATVVMTKATMAIMATMEAMFQTITVTMIKVRIKEIATMETIKVMEDQVMVIMVNAMTIQIMTTHMEAQAMDRAAMIKIIAKVTMEITDKTHVTIKVMDSKEEIMARMIREAAITVMEVIMTQTKEEMVQVEATIMMAAVIITQANLIRISLKRTPETD
jgi:hypothetical protein